MMRIPSGKVDQYLYFRAESTTGGPKTGLSSFTIRRSRNGGSETSYTTPTVVELSSANMPGVYALLIDEDTTIGASSDSEMMAIYISATGMIPIAEFIELYRRDTTSGQTLAVTSGGVTLADGVSHGGTLGSSTATLALSRASIVSNTSNTQALTVTGNGSGAGLVVTGGATGNGVSLIGGATSGDGLNAVASGGNSSGINTTGNGSGHGLRAMGGATTGSGIHARANTAASGDADGFSAIGAKNGGGITAHGGTNTGAGLGNGPGIYAASDGNGPGMQMSGGDGTSGGSTYGLMIEGGHHGGVLIRAGGVGPGSASNQPGIWVVGHGTAMGVRFDGGATGEALKLNGGATSGAGLSIATTDGHGVIIAPAGSSRHGILSTGGNGGTSDGIKAVAGTGGVDFRANMTGNITGTLSALTTAMTESYAADGAAPTPVQALFAIQQYLLDREISGTAMTIYKLDGTTPAMISTLDSATAPTTSHRTT